MTDWQTEEDLAEFQELSNKYEPEATASKHEPYLTLGKSSNRHLRYRDLSSANVNLAVL